MGWYSFSMKKPVKEWFKESLNERYEVVDIALVQRQTLYAAVKNKETGEIFCAVYLIRWSRGYHNFSYKDMDEFCGPVQSNCPMRILKLLTPLNDENDPNHWARDWRARVEKYHERNKKIKTGIIKTAKPIEFTSGRSYQYFKKIGRTMVAGVMHNDEFIPYSRVRVNLSYYEFEII